MALPLLPALALIVVVLSVPACGKDKNGDDNGPKEIPTAPAAGDFWLETLGDYMSEEFQHEYVATPEDERFRVHGAALMEFFEREMALAVSQVDLTKEQIREYHRLPDLEASSEFLRTIEESQKN